MENFIAIIKELKIINPVNAPISLHLWPVSRTWVNSKLTAYFHLWPPLVGPWAIYRGSVHSQANSK